MHPSSEDIVTGVAYMVSRLVAAESGPSINRRQAVARKARTTPGTIENIQRGRLKFLERVEANIRAAFIRLLESEITKATHELQVARLCADRVDCGEVRAAEASLGRRIEEARQVIARG